jgi:hypothetical protein
MLEKILELVIEAQADPQKLIELEEFLRLKISEEEASKNGNINIFRSVKKYINRSIMQIPKEYYGICIKDGMVYATNRYSAFRLNVELKGLPEAMNFPIEKIDATFSDVKFNNIEVELPSLKELKAQLKIARANLKAMKKQKYLTGCKLTAVEEGVVKLKNVSVDIELLVEILEVLGGENITCWVAEEKLAPVFLKSDAGEAILMPLRIEDNSKEAS